MYIRWNIDLVRELLKSKGYELVSMIYINAREKLIFRDDEGYYYFQNLDHILRKSRIPKIFHESNPYTIQNIDNWIKINKKNFVLITRKYISKKDKLVFKDNEGYYYSQTLLDFQTCITHLKFAPSNPYTIQNIRLWLKLNNKNFWILTNKYVNSNIKMDFVCKNCSVIFDVNWGNVMSGKGCPYCCNRKIQPLKNSFAIQLPELVQEWHSIRNGDLTPYDIPPSYNEKVWWHCENGHEWPASPASRINSIKNSKSNNNGCPYCCHNPRPSKNYNLLVDNPELCLEWDYTRNDKKPEEYAPYAGKRVYWICMNCGYNWGSKIFDRNRSDKSKRTNCPKCSSSKGENSICDFLEKNAINYIAKKTFDELRGKRKRCYHFDFYIPDINLCIEYQGEQHYRPIDFASRGQEWACKQFDSNQKRDKIKRDFCNKNDIKLLEIPYWDFDNIESILTAKLLLQIEDVS